MKKEIKFKAKIKANNGAMVKPFQPFPQESYVYQDYNPIYGEQQTPLQQPQTSPQGNNIGSTFAGMGRAAGQALNALAVGGPQLINALLPEQQLEREDRTIPRALNQYPQGIQGSQAIYKDGGNLKKLISGQPFAYNERYEEEIQYGVRKAMKPLPIVTIKPRKDKTPIQTTLNQLNTQSMEQFPVDMEQPQFNKVGRMVSTPYSYERGSGLGMRRESGYRSEYQEYKNGGYVERTRRTGKKGRIQITEEVPEFEDIFQPLPTSQNIPYSFAPRQVPQPIAPELRDISYETLYDVNRQPTGYAPQFSGFSFNEASQALNQLPQNFGGLPVTRGIEDYQALYPNFKPNTRSSQWMPNIQEDYYPQPLAPFEYGGALPTANPTPIGPNATKNYPFMPEYKCGGKMKKGYKNGDLMVGEETELSAKEIKELIKLGYEIDLM